VFLKARVMQTIIMGLLVGSLFYNLGQNDVRSLLCLFSISYFEVPPRQVQNTYGLLQFAALFLALGSMPQLMVRAVVAWTWNSIFLS
jgi:hypothetical protein